MKIKIFHIRLTKENLAVDQNSINEFMENIIVKKTSTQFITGQPNIWSIIVFYEGKDNQNSAKQSNKLSITDETELTTEEKQIYETFKKWRQDKAAEQNVPSFMICHNTELMTIAKVKPQSLEELLRIKGFGEQKISKFGDEIIALLNSI